MLVAEHPSSFDCFGENVENLGFLGRVEGIV